MFSTPAVQASQQKVFAASGTDFARFDTTYYLKGALCGGICCSITHGAMCPVDVVKTRIQLGGEFTGMRPTKRRVYQPRVNETMQELF